MRIRKLLFVIYFSLTCALTQAQQQPRLVLPVGHTSFIQSVSFSNDDKYFLTSSIDGTSKIWDLSSGNLLINLEGFGHYVEKATFSEDGSYVAAISSDKKVRVFNVATGKETHMFSIEINEENYINFSQDGKYLISSYNDSTARIWDLRNGKVVRDFTTKSGAIFSSFFLKDSRYIVTNSYHEVKVWDINSGICIKQHTGFEDFEYSARCSRNRKYVLTSQRDSTVSIRDIFTGNQLYLLRGYSGMVLEAVFTDNEKYVTFPQGNLMANVWDLKTGYIIHKLVDEEYMYSRLGMTISDDGKYALTWGYDDAILWSVATGDSLYHIHFNKNDQELIHGAFFSKNNKYFILNGIGNNIFYDVRSGKKLYDLEGNTKGATSASFIKNSQYVQASFTDNTTKIWDVSKGNIIHNIKSHSHYLLGSSCSRNGQYLLTYSVDSTAAIWDLVSGKEIYRLRGHAGSVTSASFSTDGKLVLTSSSDSSARLWDVTTGKELKCFREHRSSVQSASISNNNKYIITSTFNNRTIWNAFTGELLYQLNATEYPKNTACFSEDGRYLLITSEFNSAEIREVASGKIIHKLLGHKASIESVAFSKDGLYVATSSSDEAIIWDMITGMEMHRLKSNGRHISDIYFNNNGNYIVTAFHFLGSVIWDVKTGNELFKIDGNISKGSSSIFSEDGKYFITAGKDKKTSIWEAVTGKKLYTRLQLDNEDWLVYDEDYHFDGTPGAIEKLYFTCGLEIIELSQVKQSLRIRGLAQKIMNKEDLSGYKKLSDLNICGQLPLIEQTNDSLNLSYSITKRKATILRFEVLLNKKIIKTILPEKLSWKNNQTLLTLTRKEIESLFTPGQANLIKIQAVTNIEGEEIPSRGVEVSVQDYRDKKQPSLYGVFIGVNEYQDPSMSLKFPVNDALSMSSMIGSASEALMGKEKVELFNIHSDYDESKKNGYGKPTRQTVRRALEEIAEKAEPQDIVFLFLAGHGTMGNKTEKRFTFLTEEASFDNPQGFNTDTLFSWISTEGPFALKANKVILVLDACNSGQILSDLSKRSLEEEERQKQLDALADRSGMFIITASAPGKDAYELPKLEHGLLTYSLLRVLKQNASIYEKDDYVNMTRWFYEAGRDLGNLTKELKLTQEAIPSGTGDFSIMRVNASMRSGIRLAEEKQQLFLESVENITEEKPDRKLWNRIVDRIRTDKETARCFYLNDRYLEGARVLRIKYSLKGKKINCRLLVYLNDEKIKEFEIKGNTEKWEDLERAIVELLEKEYCEK